jgi:hypothetical protein
VPGDAVAFDHVEKVPGRETRQRGFAEMPVRREEIGRRGAGIGEIAAAAAGHQDLLAAAVGMFNHQHAPAALAGGQRAHQTGRTAADHQRIEGLAHACSPAPPRGMSTPCSIRC